MKPAQLRHVIDKLGVSQREFARLTGLNRNTVTAYLNGTHPIPLYVDLACRWLLHMKRQGDG